MIILRQNNYSKADLNKLGRETDKDIREAVKGTKAESKVEKILDKSTKEMKEAAQKEYAAISEEGDVILKSKDALDFVRNSNNIRKKRRPGESDVQLAKRLLDAVKHRRDKNDSEFESELLLSRQRPRIGFNRGVIESPRQNEKVSWIRAGFKPDWTEPSGQTVKLGFKKFSKINNPGVMTVEDVFSISLIRGLGKNIAVATGKVESGSFRVGDKVEISDGKNKIQTEIKGIQIFRKTVDKVSKGDDAGLEFSDISFRDIKRGMIIKVISPDQKQFSKQDREVVPADIAEKAKKDGVVQKREDGKWGIISFKTKPATWWSSSYNTKEDAESALRGYWANKH